MALQNSELSSFLSIGQQRTSLRSLYALFAAEIRERSDQHDTAVASFASEAAARAQLAAALNQRMDTVVGLAPTTLDTLKELADAINNDPQFFASIDTKLAENDADITAINQAIGISENATTLGAFNAVDLQDNASIKQVLESFAAAYRAFKDDTEAKLTVYYANQAAFPSAADYHGRVVHSHADGAQYYAHGGQWIKLANDSQIASLQADVDQNESDADAAIAAVQADVDQNEADADSAITAETAARQAADTTLQTAIDAVQADVDQNEADADASITILNNAIATLGGTDTTLQADITAEATARAAADTTLQANIDAEASARATAISNLVNGADAALDTLKEIGDALAAGDTSVTNALTAQITTEAATRTAAIAAAQTALQTAIDAVQADVDGNETDADNALATKLPLAGGTLTGSLAIQKSFPDFELKAGNEKRILFSDAGGGSTAAIKHVSSTLDLFAGGIGGSNKELSVEAGAVNVVNQLKIGGVAVTSTAAELNFMDGVTANVQVSIDALNAATAALGVAAANEATTRATADNTLTASVNLKANIDQPAFTGNVELSSGNLTVINTEPEIVLKSDSERELIFSAANGTEEGAIKFDNNILKIFTGGTVPAQEILKVETDGFTSQVKLKMIHDIEFYEAARNVKFKNNTVNALRFRATDGTDFLTLDSFSDEITASQNVNVAAGRVFFETGNQLIRLKDNQGSALKIEIQDGTSQDFLEFKTSNSGPQLILGAPNQVNNTITVGEDDTGYDVKFFGATSGAYVQWDESEDDLIVGGTAAVKIEGLTDAANDAAAATAGVAVNQLYRNGSVVMIRVS